MDDKEKQMLLTRLTVRVGREAAEAVLGLVGLSGGGNREPLEGRYQVVLVDEEAALPECPFMREAKTLEKRFRDEADTGSVQETHAVYDKLKMAECRCDGWAHACAEVAGAGFVKVVEPAS
ncbi:MAG: hypothetical protein JW846_10900 [Dehalococcoidia bacterium]|nr:hypothetical protein [Dehalococcoidia bacterium]